MAFKVWQKTAVCCAAGLTLASAASAQNLLKGTKEIGLRGGVDFDSSAGTEVNLGFGYGYYIFDQVELGGFLQVLDNDIERQWEVSGFLQYDIDLERLWVPYIQGRVGWARGEVSVEDEFLGEMSEENDAVIGTLRPGIRYHFNDYVALDLSADFQAASEDIFSEDEGDVANTQITLNWGIRAYW